MNTAYNWIQHLELIKHPEGGYYKEIYRSDEKIPEGSLPNRFKGNRSFATSIYYLLENNDFSAFHRIHSDETWHFYSGSTLQLYVLQPDGKLHQVFLSNLLKSNHHLQYTVPFGCWFAAEMENKNEYALLGCTVSPVFDFADFQMAEKSKMLDFFPQHAELIEKLCK